MAFLAAGNPLALAAQEESAPPTAAAPEEEFHDVAGREAPTDQSVEARRMLGRCEEIIEYELTPLQRRIFHLKHLRRQPIRSIAEALGKSEDAVKANA